MPTTNLLLPFLSAGQAQKHVTVNESLRMLDGIVQLAVKDADLADPPASPSDGDRYIVPAAATGAWFAAPGPWLGALALGLYVAVVTRLARDETAPNTKFPPARIGRLLGLLIPLQALLGVAAIHRFPVNLLALALLPLAPLRRRLARRYPPS